MAPFSLSECSFEKGFVHPGGDVVDEFFPWLETHLVEGRYLPYFLDDPFVVGCHDLGAITPVNFVPVVFGRVVGGGDHYAAVAAKVPDRKGQLGGWPQV